MSTWQILPDAGNTYRWVISGQDPPDNLELPSRKTLIHHKNPNSRLPSMEDLLIQGSAKLFQNCGDTYDDKAPMFRTGSGKSVELKQSSIEKALSVLGECDVGNDRGSSKFLRSFGDKDDGKGSMFRTGSGKAVEVKQSSVRKALSVLGEDNVSDRGTSKFILESGGIHNEKSGLFRTGMGKSVQVKESSVKKALSVLGQDDVMDRGQAFGSNNGGSFSKSVFQTGSGKMVHLSSGGLVRAKALLGLDESSDQSIDDELNGRKNSPNLEKREKGFTNGTVESRSISRHPVNSHTDKYRNDCGSKELVPDPLSTTMLKYNVQPPPVKFESAGGRSISVSNDALQRAMCILGDPECENLSNMEGAEGPLFSFPKENSFKTTSFNIEGPFLSLQHELAKTRTSSKRFLPPKVPIFKENQGSTTIGTFSSMDNFLRQVDENDSSHKELSKLNPLSKDLNPSMHVKNALEKNFVTRTNQLKTSSGGPLVDISNNIGTASADQKEIPREKRKFGRRSSVSPFKKPRSSRFSTPLNSNIYSLPNGSSTLTAEESCCKGNVFPRYPFQGARATVKDFFAGPPCRINQLEQVASEVKFMNVETAEAYMFNDAPHLNGIGAEGLGHMLVKSGASPQYATHKT